MISIDMDMPKSCDTCQFRYLRGTLEAEGPAITDFCTLKLKAIKDAHKRADFCPLSEDDPMRAAKTIRNYCSEVSCSDCVFDSDEGCVLNDVDYIPAEWKLPQED